MITRWPFLIALLFLAGCTAGSASGPLFQKHAAIDPSGALLYVYKPQTAGQDGVTTCLTLEMNKEEYGCLRGRGFLKAEVAPGLYDVALVNKAGFGFRLLEFEITLEPGSVTYLEYAFGNSASRSRSLDTRYAGLGIVISGNHTIVPVDEGEALAALSVLSESI